MYTPLNGQRLSQYLEGQYTYQRPPQMDQQIYDIISKATTFDPGNRPTMNELEHDLHLILDAKVIHFTLLGYMNADGLRRRSVEATTCLPATFAHTCHQNVMLRLAPLMQEEFLGSGFLNFCAFLCLCTKALLFRPRIETRYYASVYMD